MTPPQLRLGTLGSPATFAGEATAELRRFYPEFADPVFFPTMEACWDAIERRLVDVGVLGVERTGQPHHGEPVLRRGLHVHAAIALPLRCNLYVKAGASREAVTTIIGHGSIHQCKRYLDAHFPGVPQKMHDLNSVEAARSVIGGDGRVALVGSRSVSVMVEGLEVIARDIDDGAVSNWWAISALPHFEPHPDTLIVVGRFSPDGDLADVVESLAGAGFRLAAAAAFAANQGVSTYDYFLTFGGSGPLERVQAGLSERHGVRLVGAFKNRTKAQSSL